MLVLNTESLFKATKITFNGKLVVSRIYLDTTDVPQLKNRLSIKLAVPEAAKLLTFIESGFPDNVSKELKDAVAELKNQELYAIIPIILRKRDVPYTSFKSNDQVKASLNLVGDVSIYMHGTFMPTICAACAKQQTLRGSVCPNYVKDSFSCFESTNFFADYMDTFILTEKGELIYNATPTSKLS